MNEIRCPSCGKVFQVDEAGYAAIVAQVHTEQFEKEIADRLKAAQRELEARRQADAAEAASRHQQEVAQKEQEMIRQAQEALNADRSIPCTACHYCTDGCPMNIPIPEIFNVINRRKGSPEFRTIREYGIVTQDRGKASDCIACGQCEGICPQHLPIISLLEDCRAQLEK